MGDTTRSVKIYINGREVENTLKGVSQAMTKTRNELSKLTVGGDEYNKKSELFKGIKKKRPNFLGRQSKDAIFGDAFDNTKITIKYGAIKYFNKKRKGISLHRWF